MAGEASSPYSIATQSNRAIPSAWILRETVLCGFRKEKKILGLESCCSVINKREDRENHRVSHVMTASESGDLPLLSFASSRNSDIFQTFVASHGILLFKVWDCGTPSAATN